MNLTLINNRIVSEDEALISIKDRGFRFGDGVFETVPFYNKVTYRLDDHIERLKGGLRAIRINFETEGLEGRVKDLIDKNSIKTGFARICITRGEGGRGYLPTYKTSPTIVIEIVERREMEIKPVPLVISEYKKIPSECLPTNYKLMNGLNYSLAKEAAKNKGFFDGVLLSMDDKVCECSSSNIFWFKGDNLYTPSLSTGALNGITRKAIIEISPHEVVEGEFNYLKLSGADEVFITNVTLGVLSIDKIAPTIFRNGRGYKKTSELREKYLQDIFNKTGIAVRN